LTEKKQDDQAGGADPQETDEQTASSRMPAPWSLAMAVLGMLALGVLIGSVTSHYSQNTGFTTVLLESAAPPAEEAASPETTGGEPAATGAGGESAATATPSTVATEAPLVEEPLPGDPSPEVPLVEEELPTGLPEVKHVFVVMRKEGSVEETGKSAEATYLGKELPQQGELLTNYFGVTDGALANQIALLSGQGPTPQTAANCPDYGDVSPGTELAEGQVEGDGCVYPATTKTLPGQLAEAGLKWKAYVQGIEDGAAAGQPIACRHPSTGTADPNQVAAPTDAYLTWRNPFVYFHSIVDTPECAEANVGLPELDADLKLKADKFPALVYIAPDETQLEPLVAELKESLAYKDGGLIVVTAAQAPQEGESADHSGCCIDPAFPNLPDPEGSAPPTGPVRETDGGGRVGLLLLSPFVEAGTRSETYFNHFSLLATIEELFGLERIGYAAEPAITGFDESLFNASS
jgi:hypothetical protein